MKFSYTALGDDNQKLTGILEAASLQAAQEALHKMDLSIIALQESTEKNPKKESNVEILTEMQSAPEIKTYYFVAKDPQGKEVNGTIDSNEPYLAYKRLIRDYQFEVLEITENDQEETSENSLKANFSAWNGLLREEGQEVHAKTMGAVKNELADEGEKMADEIVTEIDHFILNTKKIIGEHGAQYSKGFLQKIEATLGNLERIRSSNNLNHITRVCNDLYELIANPDKHSEEAGNSENQAYQQMIQSLKESGFVEKKNTALDLRQLEKKEAGFKNVKGIFSKIQNELSHSPTPFPVTPGIPPTPLMAKNHGFTELASKYFHSLIERNPILKRARKQEFKTAYMEWKAYKNQFKADKTELKTAHVEMKLRKDFTSFFMELDSFVGWLIFFYLSYFFLASFSLERNVGLPQELVVETLSSPLVINICIFLLIAHLTLRLKIRLFRQNLLGSAFLFFFSLGAYALLIANF